MTPGEAQGPAGTRFLSRLIMPTSDSLSGQIGSANKFTGCLRNARRTAALTLLIGALVLQSTTAPWWVSAQSPDLVAAFSFDEGTGTAVQDMSGNGNSGMLVGGATWTPGSSGSAVAFDGVAAKVSLPSTLDITALPFTLEAWVRPANYSGWHVIFSKRNSYSQSAMRFDVGLVQSNGRVYVTTGGGTVRFTYAPPLNQWTHLAVVATTTGTQLYVNGALQQTLGSITLGTASGAAVNIGRTGDNDDPFAGAIDDLRLYKRALSLAEIQFDMATPVQVPGPHLTITQPASGATIPGSTVTVGYVTSGDLSEVDHAHFQLDSNPEVMDLTLDGIYQFANVPLGSHTLIGRLVRADHSAIPGTDASVAFLNSSGHDTANGAVKSRRLGKRCPGLSELDGRD